MSSTVTKKAFDLAAKKQCRSSVLALLKSDDSFVAQNGLSRAEQSVLVGRRLIELFRASNLFGSFFPQQSNSASSLSSSSMTDPQLAAFRHAIWNSSPLSNHTINGEFAAAVASHPKRISILCYFSMWYELDLTSLFAEVWAAAAAASATGEGPSVHVYVPHMLPPVTPATRHSDDTAASSSSTAVSPSSSPPTRGGNMVFVEVLSAADQSASFVPQGKMKILEIRPEVLQAALENGDRDLLFTTMDTLEELSMRNRSPTVGEPVGLRPRTKPVVDRVRSGEECFLVLTPAAAYDREMHRMGKGGGFYDRFLHALRQAESEPTLRQPPPSFRRVMVIGVGFDQQLLPEGVEVPFEEGWDQPVDAVLTGRDFLLGEKRGE